MKLRLLNVLTVLSLLLCVAVAALWVRSYFVHERLTWQEELFHSAANERLKMAAAFSGDGSVGVCFRTANKTSPIPIRWSRAVTEVAAPPGVAWDRDWEMPDAPDPTTIWQRIGFRLDREPASYTADGYYGVRFPTWLPVVLFATMPVHAHWRRNRRPAGHCRQCGYDLRATPGRCPECGAAPSVHPSL